MAGAVSLKKSNYEQHSMAVPYLPAELIDQIIDHLHGNPAALRACSLTCRAWTASAQFHIFHTISLTRSPKRAEAFMRLLDTSPHIGRLVRDLAMDTAMPRRGIVPWAKVIIRDMNACLVNLKKLSMRGFNFHHHTGVHSALVHSFTSVRFFTLSKSSFATFDDFALFLIHHPHIEEMVLKDVSWADDDPLLQSGDQQVDIPTTHTLARLRTLSFTGRQRCAERFVDWIIVQQPPLHIETVHFLDLSIKAVPALAKLLHHLGAILKHLSLGFKTTFDIEEAKGVAQVISLQHCTSLRVLIFEQLSLWHTAQNDWIPKILAQVTSSSLEETAFRIFDWDVSDDLERLDLPLIDRILTRPAFTSLQRVVISLFSLREWGGVMGHQEVGRKIRSKMTGLDDRMLLVLE